VTRELHRQRWSNKSLALGILGGMACMALIGLVISLGTWEVRRAHDAGLPKDRTLPLYLGVFVGVWVVGLAFVAVREMQVRHQRAGGLAAMSANRATTTDIVAAGYLNQVTTTATIAAGALDQGATRTSPSRLPLGYVLATIGLIALAGLAVTMLAVQISAQRASRPGLDRDESPVRIVAPAELAGLGYLPTDSDLIAGVHIAEAFKDPLAREFLVKMSFRVGKNEVGLRSIEQWTGVKLRDIDHVALGLRLKNSLLFPRMTLVVRTRLPYDAAAVRKALQASPAPEPDKKELYKITLGESVLDRVAIVWFADSTTLVLGLSANDFKRVPTTPREGVDNLPPDLVRLMKQMGKGTPAWLVGSPESWEKSTAWDMLVRRAKDDPSAKLLAKVQGLGVWFHFGNGMTLNAAFVCPDPATAKSLDKVLTGADGERKPLELPAPKRALEPIYKELGQTLNSKQDRNWLRLQAKASEETLRKAFAD
jgi:hypothetical protein